MNRYWASWWTSYHITKGCTKPPFQMWTSGERGWNEDWNGAEELSMVAVIHASNKIEIIESLVEHFPDHKMRFIHEVDANWTPNDRFPDFDEKQSYLQEKD